MDEQVDILVPPLFVPNGQTKTRQQAYNDGDWIGTFNLWIVTRSPEPAIIYQQRSPNSPWAPNALDVSAGGHLQAGEKLTDGLREVDEELGKQYKPSQLLSLGRKIYVGHNSDGSSHNNIIDLYMVEDNSPLDSYTQQMSEVYALCVCPIAELLHAHQDDTYSFTAKGLTAEGKPIDITVNKQLFPQNWDNYHYKIAILADRYCKGEKNLLY